MVFALFDVEARASAEATTVGARMFPHRASTPGRSSSEQTTLTRGASSPTRGWTWPRGPVDAILDSAVRRGPGAAWARRGGATRPSGGPRRIQERTLEEVRRREPDTRSLTRRALGASARAGGGTRNHPRPRYVLVTITRGLDCLHPLAPRRIVSIGYSERRVRGTPSLLAPGQPLGERATPSSGRSGSRRSADGFWQRPSQPAGAPVLLPGGTAVIPTGYEHPLVAPPLHDAWGRWHANDRRARSTHGSVPPTGTAVPGL